MEKIIKELSELATKTLKLANAVHVEHGMIHKLEDGISVYISKGIEKVTFGEYPEDIEIYYLSGRNTISFNFVKFSDITTDKLFDFLLKYSNLLDTFDVNEYSAIHENSRINQIQRLEEDLRRLKENELSIS